MRQRVTKYTGWSHPSRTMGFAPGCPHRKLGGSDPPKAHCLVQQLCSTVPFDRGTALPPTRPSPGLTRAPSASPSASAIGGFVSGPSWPGQGVPKP